MNKKKNYLKPQISVLHLQIENSIATGSPIQPSQDGDFRPNVDDFEDDFTDIRGFEEV